MGIVTFSSWLVLGSSENDVVLTSAILPFLYKATNTVPVSVFVVLLKTVTGTIRDFDEVLVS